MKGNAVVIWTLIILAIFAIILIYNSMSQVLDIFTPKIQSQINTSTPFGGNASNTMDTLAIVWSAWPIFLIFGLIVFGFVAVQKRDNF